MALEPDTLDSDCECPEGTPAWMATFSDLATLLLTFFVLLLSFAEMDVVEFKEMLGSVREAFGVQFERQGHIEALSTTVVELNDKEEVPWTPLNQRQLGALRAIKRFIRQRKMNSDMAVGMSERGVVVRLKDSMAFGVGDAKLKKKATVVLEQVMEMMKAFPTSMSIEGHTDDLPIKNGRYKSNWELSASRAIAVLRHLESMGPLPVKKVMVAGHADQRPLVPNDSRANRAKNRRVEFVFASAQSPDASEAEAKAKAALKNALGDMDGARGAAEEEGGGASDTGVDGVDAPSEGPAAPKKSFVEPLVPTLDP